MIVFLMTGEIPAQATFNHRFHFGMPVVYNLSGVIVTDSAYYATGTVIDTVNYHFSGIFVKFNLEGNPVLTKVLSNPSQWIYPFEPAFVETHDHQFASLALATDSIRRFMLIKYDDKGDTIFTKTYLHPQYPAEHFLYPYNLIVTDDEGFLMVGNMEGPNPVVDTDVLLIKTNSLGNEEWKKYYGTALNEKGICVARSKTGNGYVIGANRNNTNTNVEDYIYRAYVFEVDSLGNVLWQFLSPPDTLRDWAHDIALHADGSISVASGVGVEIPLPSYNLIHFDKAIFRLSPAHEMEWERVFKNYPMSASVQTYKIVDLSDESGIVMAGKSYEPLSPGYAYRGWFAKISHDGDSIWAREYEIVDTYKSEHTVFDMKQTQDGGFIVCGESFDRSGQDSILKQAWLLKLDEHGCLVPGCHLTDATNEEPMPGIQLAIYPNPTTDYLNFYLKNGPQGKEASFRILDANGCSVSDFGGSAANTTFIVPVWNWPAGVYFLQYLEGGEVQVTERFVKL